MRLLNVLDEYNQLCLTIQVDRHCRVAEIIDTIEDLLKLYDHPVICKWTMTWSSWPRQRAGEERCMSWGLAIS